MTTDAPRLSVCLTFDWDAMSAWLGGFGSRSPSLISRGEFGAFALPRILQLLARHEIRSTFFVPGHTALAYPDLLRRVRDDGHEIGHHGWVHEYPDELDLDGERAAFERGLEALDEVAGVRPTGYRAPAARVSVDTVDVLCEYGMAYDSSYAATDFHPYYLRRGDRFSATEPYEFGTCVDVVEVPFPPGMFDFGHFELIVGWSGQQSPPSAVREIWQAEFAYAHAHCPGGVLDLTLHPQVIGRGSRLVMLEALVEHMKGHDGVRFETLGACVERWRSRNPRERWERENPVLAGRPSARSAG